MQENAEGCVVLDHVNVISETIFVLEFMEEALMTFDSFSKRGGIGMEVIVREYVQKLKRSRDFLFDYIPQLQQSACPPAVSLLSTAPCGEPATTRGM